MSPISNKEDDKLVSSLSQPKALRILFFAEMWERFSFYGLRALLMLYMVSELGQSDTNAYSIYGIYLALVCASTIIGGYLADRYLGNLRAIILGSFIIVIGHICLILPLLEFFSYGLAFIIVGTSLFKSNVSSLLGEYYTKNDPRRDAGFTIFYMGVNIGPLIAPLICGYIGQEYGWHYGFGFAGLGMLLGIVVLFRGHKELINRGQPPLFAHLDRTSFLNLSRYHWIIIGCLLSVPLFAWAIKNHETIGNFLNIFGIGVLFVLMITALRAKKEERTAMLTLLIMLPFVTAFFASFEQAGASMNLFTDRYVNRLIGDIKIPTTWFQSLNPLFVVLLAPLFSWLWNSLGRKGRDPLTPIKFILALFLVGFSFFFLKIGVGEALFTGKSSILWLILAYLLQTMGELCLNPVGLSMVTKLAPARFASFMMGCFFLSIAFAHLMAQQIAKYFSTSQDLKVVETMVNNQVSLKIFEDIFQFLIYLPLVAGLILLILNPFLKNIFKQYQ